MSDNVEQLTRQIAELTTLVREKGQSAKTELQWDGIKEQFEAEIKALVNLQVQEKLDRAPVRRQPGVPVYIEGNLPDLKGNRYRHMIKNIMFDGYHRIANRKLKAVDLVMAQMFMEQANVKMPGQAPPPSDELRAAVKALDTSTSGSGAELTATETMAELWDDFYLSSMVVSNLMVIDPMPTDPYNLPLGLGDVTWKKGTQNQPSGGQTPSTAQSVLTTTEQVAEVNWSYSLDEDSVVAFMPALRARLVISGGEAMDAFALNADSTATATGNINLDDAAPAANAYYLSDGQDGIRHMWIVDNAATVVPVNAGGDALADADIVGALGNMGKYAVNPTSVLQICDVSTYLGGYLNLDTVITIDKFGAGATVLTGQLAAYRGIPIIPSVSHPLGEADGKVSTTSASNTLGSISVINRMMWYAGFKRDLLIEVDRDIRTRQLILVASFREAIGAHGTRATAPHTTGVYNILV